jgi:hypothetical protein
VHQAGEERQGGVFVAVGQRQIAQWLKVAKVIASVSTAGEMQFLGAQAGWLVGNSQAAQIGFAGVCEFRLDFNAGEQLLAFLVHAQQVFIRFQLGEQPDLAAVHVLGFQRGNGAQTAEIADVLIPDRRGVQGRVVAVGHIAQILRFDGAAIGGFPAGGDTFPIRDKGAGHGRLFAWCGFRCRHLMHRSAAKQTLCFCSVTI